MSGVDSLTAEDLAYVFGRLDWEHVEACAAAARRAWMGAGTAVFEVALMPGDGTHYGLLFAVLGRGLPVLGAPGGGTGGYPPNTATGCWPFDGSTAAVTYVQAKRTMFVGAREFVHPTDLHEDIGRHSTPASSLALAAFLNEVTGQDPAWRQRMIDNYRAAEKEEAT